VEIKVLIVDDEILVLDSLERIIEKDPDLTLVGRATSGPEGIRAARAARPDVVLMDLLLKGDMDGVQATRQIRNALNPPAVLAVTSFDSDTYLRDALEAGAVGFLLKTDAVTRLSTAIHMAYDGDPMISPAMTRELINSYVAPQTDPACEKARRQVAVLTDREIEVATLVGAGRTYGGIAAELFISESTVKKTIGNALRKVSAETGAQLAAMVAMARLDLLDGAQRVSGASSP